jgi:CBS domain-containing protein
VIHPATSISEINELLVTHNIGRLPVIEKENWWALSPEQTC